MIGYLKGTIAGKDNDHVLVNVNNVAYEVFLSSSTLTQLNLNEHVELFIHTNVKEDALDLYGFLNNDEKKLFRILLSISGVGPRLAMTILNAMDPEALLNIIRMGNSKLLTKVPGIGNRTAERIILELKDKPAIKTFVFSKYTNSQTSGSEKNINFNKITTSSLNLNRSNFDDALNALIALGYKDFEASTAIQTVMREDLNLNDIIKNALKELSS